jgi:hypothetical protein
VRKEIDEFDRTKRYLVSQGDFAVFYSQETAAAVERKSLRTAAETPPDEKEQNMMSRLAGIGRGYACANGPLVSRLRRMSEEGRQRTENPGGIRGKNIASAHTVQRLRTSMSLRGMVFLIDTGMLSKYWRDGRASALEIPPTGDSMACIWMARNQFSRKTYRVRKRKVEGRKQCE